MVNDSDFLNNSGGDLGSDFFGNLAAFFAQEKDQKNWLESNHITYDILGWFHDLRDHDRAQVIVQTEWIGWRTSTSATVVDMILRV
jgi:hypothetical protein